MIKTSSKILQRWLLLWSKNSPLPLNDILDPFFIQCRGPQCQFMWRVHLKKMVFTLCIYDSEDTIWFPRKYSFDFFCTKWDLRVLNSSPKSMNWELSFVVRPQFWRGSTKEFAILVNRIFPTLLAAWSRQQYPCTWVKLSLTKRKNISRFTSISSLFWWSSIVPLSFGRPYD